MAGPWQPLLSGADAAHALDLVRAVAADATGPSLPHTPAHDEDGVGAHTASLAGGPGLLTGTAGLALALLAAATEIEPEWDRALLLSARNLAR